MLSLLLAASALEANQEQLYQALRGQHLIHEARQLVRMSYVGTLQVGTYRWAVVDSRELIHGASTPRGYNQILVLDEHLKLVKAIAYSSEEPLYCRGNRLYLYGDLAIDNVLPEGNVLTFDGQAHVTVTAVEANDVPLPETGQRPRFRLP